MAITHDLNLPEEVLLLALHDDEGTIELGSMVDYAIGGAIIAELALRERIAVEKVRKSMLVNVRDGRPTGEAVLDEALGKMRTAKKRAAVETWVTRLAGTKARRTLTERLHTRGIVRRDEGRFLFVFRRDIYPTVDPRPEADAIARMRRAIVDGETADARTAILIGLAQPTGLLRAAFDRKTLKAHRQRIDQIRSLDHVADATQAAVRSAIDAAMVAIMAATTAATITATS